MKKKVLFIKGLLKIEDKKGSWFFFLIFYFCLFGCNKKIWSHFTRIWSRSFNTIYNWIIIKKYIKSFLHDFSCFLFDLNGQLFSSYKFEKEISAFCVVTQPISECDRSVICGFDDGSVALVSPKIETAELFVKELNKVGCLFHFLINQ